MARVRKRPAGAVAAIGIEAGAEVAAEPVPEVGPVPQVEVRTAEVEMVEVEAAFEPRLERGGGFYDALYATGLSKVLAIAGRELGSFFVSPIGWVITPIVILFASWFGYVIPVIGSQQANLDAVFSIITFVLTLLIVPLVTMRLLADERRQGTLEMLLTSPVRDWELVVGKWLGALGFLGAMFSFTLVYLVLFLVYLPKVTLHPFGIPITIGNLYFGLILSGYLGLFAIAASFTAVGVLCSSITQNQIVAAFLTFGALVFLYYCGIATQVLTPPYSDFFQYIGGANRYAGFGIGQIALKDAVYFLSITFGSLFLATRVLESRRWR